jgi:hypothetical protein
MTMALTDILLLDWLEREESSALGECDGELLDGLVAKGYAVIVPPPGGGDHRFSRVMVTEAGRAYLTRSRTAIVELHKKIKSGNQNDDQGNL